MRELLMMLLMLLLPSPVFVGPVISRVASMSCTRSGNLGSVTTTNRQGRERSWSDVRLRLDLPLTRHTPVELWVTMPVIDANITTGMVMKVPCLPAGRVVGAVEQSSGLTSGKRVGRRRESGVVTAGCTNVDAPSANRTLAWKDPLGHDHDCMILRAKSRESIGNWPTPVLVEGMFNPRLVLHELTTDQCGESIRLNMRCGSSTPG